MPTGDSRISRREAQRTAAAGRSPRPVPRSSRDRWEPGGTGPSVRCRPNRTAAAPPNQRFARAMFRSDSATAAGSAAGSSSSSVPMDVIASPPIISPEHRVPAAVIEERVAVAGGAAHDAAEHDGVVAGGILRVPLTDEVGEYSIEQDQPFRAEMVPDAVEAILMLVGEPAGQYLLGTADHVHDELRRLHDHIMQLGFPVHAGGDQRGLKRYRRQAAGGHPHWLAVRSGHRQHRDAGGEPAQELPELIGIDVRAAHRSIRARKSGLSTERSGTKPPA